MAKEKGGITRRRLLFGGLATATSAVLPGCGMSSNGKEKLDKSNERIHAEVLEEVYENSLSGVPEKHINGLVSQAHSNETVRLNSKYTLKVKRLDNGRFMAISVIDNGNGGKEALDRLIQKGSKISFPRGNLFAYSDKYSAKEETRRSHVREVEKAEGDDLLEDQDQTYVTGDTQVALKRYDVIKVE